MVYGCDSYNERKKLVSELSLLFNENRTEFDKIHDYIYSDSLYKFFTLENRDYRIEVKIGDNLIKIDSIVQIKDNPDVYQILTFMREKGIRSIYGYGKDVGIKIAFEDFKYPCFEFLYEPDFNLNDERVQELIQNIENSKTKNWIYVLNDKWFIHGLKCF
jgi:hypothetical protein